jgi:hypothetical protein
MRTFAAVPALWRKNGLAMMPGVEMFGGLGNEDGYGYMVHGTINVLRCSVKSGTFAKIATSVI